MGRWWQEIVDQLPFEPFPSRCPQATYGFFFPCPTFREADGEFSGQGPHPVTSQSSSMPATCLSATHRESARRVKGASRRKSLRVQGRALVVLIESWEIRESAG